MKNHTHITSVLNSTVVSLLFKVKRHDTDLYKYLEINLHLYIIIFRAYDV